MDVKENTTPISTTKQEDTIERFSPLVLKRNRSYTADVEDSQIEKRMKKEDFMDEELELRDKFLDELSSPSLSNPSSQDSVNNHVNASQSGSGGENDNQLRKIIKLEGPLPKLALPDGWIALNHRSGGIIYLHRATRVCTWARPYYIGKGSVRKHDVPVAAIPCLHQKKGLMYKPVQTREPQTNSSQKPSVDGLFGGGSVLNFLNTAGSTDNQTEQVNEDITGKKGQSGDMHRSEAVGSNDSDNGSTTDNGIIGLGHVCNSDHNGSFPEKLVGGSDGDSNQSNSNTVDVSVIEENKCDDNHLFNAFHPKDGLDVVNDTLSVYFEMKQKADNCLPKNSSTEFDSMSIPIPSSKLDLSPKKLQSTSFRSITNDGLYKTANTNDFEMGNSIAHYCSPSANQTTGSENSNFSKCQTTSNTNSLQNDFNKNEQSELLNSTHQKSGIELIDAEELNSYLSKVFEFEELTFQQEQNVVKSSDHLADQGDTTLSSVLECLPYCVKGKTAKENKGWTLNPGGKTPVAILHEYSQAVLKEKPVYVCSECENGATPFMAEVQINGITHGSGVATSKKQAKQIAAEVALEVLLPDVFHKIRDYVISREELECFDKLKIDDHHVYEVSIKSGLPSPSQVLQECLKRNQGVCSSTINFKIVPGEYQNHSFKISCGKHAAEGFCKNKKIGKQLASQALLMKLHPHISTWGSLLRIYCDRPSCIVKKYKTSDEQSLSNCISKSDAPRGQLLLARLKEEMRKIADSTKQGSSKYLGEHELDSSSISTVDI